MDGNQKQGEWILKYGFLPEAVLSKAWEHLQQEKNAQDLCELLVGRGLLTRDQAEQVRRSSFGEKSSQLPSIPGYSLGRELGQGGMGRVFLAHRIDSGQDVVVKVLLNREGDFLRFQREARVLAQLSHPHIVKVLHFDQAAGRPYIVMEHVVGQDLKGATDKQKSQFGRLLDYREVLRILTHIADALALCHTRKVVHRDVKPHNILIEEKSGRPVLIDFGLAQIQDEELRKRLDSDSKGLTQSGEVLGTPQFMAPESLDVGRGGSELDVWGLGATFYYALTGVPPYDGANSLNVFKSLATRDPKDISVVNPAVPGALAELCMSCLQRDPKERPSMAKLASELRTLSAAHSSELAASYRKSAFAPGMKVILALFCAAIMLALILWLNGQQKNGAQQSGDAQLAKLSFQLTNSDDFQEDGALVFRTRRARLPVKVSVSGAQGPFSYQVGGGPRERFDERSALLFLDVAKSPLTLTVFDRENKPFKQLITIVQDKLSPQFKLSPQPPRLNKFTIRGTLSEPCRWVKVNGHLAQLEGNEFYAELTLDRSYANIELEAIDRCGNLAKERAPYMIIDPRKPGRLSLRSAVQSVRGGTLYLLPGVYREGVNLLNTSVDIVAAPDAILEIDDTRIGLAVRNGQLNWRGGQIRFRGQSRRKYLIFLQGGRMSFSETQFDIEDRGQVAPMRIRRALETEGCPAQLRLSQCKISLKSRTGQLIAAMGGECQIIGGELNAQRWPEFSKTLARKSVIEAAYGHFLTLRDLKIQCQQRFLSLVDSEAQLSRCRLVKFTRDGLWLKKSYLNAANCQFEDFEGVGLRVDNLSQARLEDCFIQAAQSEAKRSYGVLGQRQSQVQLIRTKVRGCNAGAAFVSGQSSLEIVDCELQSSKGPVVRTDLASTLLAGRSSFKTGAEGRIVLSRKGGALFEECQFSKMLFIASRGVQSHFVRSPDYVKLDMKLDPESAALQRIESAKVRPSFWKSRSARGAPLFQELDEIFKDLNDVFRTEGYTPTIHIKLPAGRYRWPGFLPRVDLKLEGEGDPGQVILVVDKAIEMGRFKLQLKNLTLLNNAKENWKSPTIQLSLKGRLRMDHCRLESKGAKHIQGVLWSEAKPSLLRRSRIELNHCVLSGSREGSLAVNRCILEMKDCITKDGAKAGGGQDCVIELGPRSQFLFQRGSISGAAPWAVKSKLSKVELRDLKIENPEGGGLSLESSLGRGRRCQWTVKGDAVSSQESSWSQSAAKDER